MAHKLASIAVAVGLLVGWVIFLAGVARGTDICAKGRRGDLVLITSADNLAPAPLTNGATQTQAQTQAQAEAIANQIANSINASLGRKLKETETLATRGRALLDRIAQDCGIETSLFWWVVALQFLVLIGSFLAIGGSKYTGVFAAFLYINTALLCFLARDEVKRVYDFQMNNAKGPIVDQSRVSSAGIIITLIFNFLFIIVHVPEVSGSVTPAC